MVKMQTLCYKYLPQFFLLEKTLQINEGNQYGLTEESHSHLLLLFILLHKVQSSSGHFPLNTLQLPTYNPFSPWAINLGMKMTSKLREKSQDFPGGPVVKTLCSQCRGPRFDP